MKTLIWKELRELVWPAAIIAGIFLVIALVDLTAGRADEGCGLLATVALYFLGPLVGLLMGCWALARERQTGTDVVLNSQPVSRGQVWGVKLSVSLLVLAVVYGIMLGLTGAADPSVFHDAMLEVETFGVMVLWLHIAITFFMFALGFALSGIRRHAFEATLVAALLCLLLGLLWMFLTADVLPRFWGPQLGVLYSLTPFTTPIILAVLVGVGLLVASGYGFISALPLAYGRRYWRTVALGASAFALIMPVFFIGVRYAGEPQLEDIHTLEGGLVSSDGQWIAFLDSFLPMVGISRREELRLWLMRTDGSGLRCLARAPVVSVDWSPDSRQIAVIWGDPDADFHLLPRKNLVWIWLLDVPGGRATRLPFEIEQPERGAEFSPQGTYLQASDQVFRIRPKPETVPVQLPVGASLEYRSWAADDSRVYFSLRNKQDPNITELWAMELPEGRIVGPLANSPAGFGGTIVLPGAEWIAWRRTVKKEGQSYSRTVAAMIERLSDGRSFEVQGYPFRNIGAKRLQYLWVKRGKGICIFDLNKQRMIRELAGSLWEYEPAIWLHWSQDDSQVAFFTQTPQFAPWEDKSPLRLWVANADGPNLRYLMEGSPNALCFETMECTTQGNIIMQVDHERVVSVDPDTGEQKDILVVPNPERRECE